MNRLVLLFLIHSISCTSFTCDPTISCGCSLSTTVTSRIVGGETANNHTWGWMLSLQESQKHRCGASLLTPEYAVTAAHCVNKNNIISSLSIVAGTNYWTDKTSRSVQRRAITEIYIHPDYDATTDSNDIAIIHFSSLSTSLNSTLSFICLPIINQNPFVVGSDLVAIGWGVTHESSKTASSYLQQVTVQVFSSTSDDCIRAQVKNLTSQFCAGIDGGGKDTCQGDSGGPLMAFIDNRWILAGITSAGIGCAHDGYPGLYTRVSSFIPFIEYIVNFTAIQAPSVIILKTNTMNNQGNFLGKSIFILMSWFSVMLMIK